MADVSVALADVAGETTVGGANARNDVANEAWALAAAVIDADNRYSDTEIRALIHAFGALLPARLAGATPDTIRDSGLLAGKRTWLEQPSLLFDTLRAYDLSRTTSLARTYYLRAMDLLHATAALDGLSTRAELEAIERFRAIAKRDGLRLIGLLSRALDAYEREGG